MKATINGRRKAAGISPKGTVSHAIERAELLAKTPMEKAQHKSRRFGNPAYHGDRPEFNHRLYGDRALEFLQ